MWVRNRFPIISQMPQPIKVLQVIDTLNAGGAERVLVELVNNLDPQVVTPSVCVTRSNITLLETIRTDIPVYQLKRRSTWDWRAIKEFGQIVRNNSIDIIHAHGYSSSHFVTAAKTVNFLPTPFIIHAHNSSQPGMLTRLVARIGPTHFIGVAPELVDWARLLLGFSEGHVTLLGNAIDTARYEAANPIDVSLYFNPRPRFLGLVIANLRPVKDLDTLFHALSVSCFRDQIGILIAGSTQNSRYVKHCNQLLTKLDLDKRVAFLGSYSELPQLLASVDFGVLSSKQESGPVALLEYMASALPFVVTRTGYITEMAFKAGLPGVVPTQNYTQFASSLDQMLALPTVELKTRGLQGKGFLMTHLSLKDRINTLQKIYLTLANRSGSSSNRHRKRKVRL